MSEQIKKRILGIDFNDFGTIVSYYSDERKWSYPSAVCKDRTTNSWIIGQSAYERVLSGNGIITDKLESFIYKNKNTTLYGVNYNAVELLTRFFEEVVRAAVPSDDGLSQSTNQDLMLPDEIVIAVPHINGKIVADITLCFVNIGMKEERVHVISRSEAFIYYTMSQSQDLHNNNVGMFSLEDNNLTYYELKTQRKGKSTFVFADSRLMDESFNLDILNDDAGAKLADKILLNAAESLLKNKIFSCIILTGSGFERQDWAPDFMKLICNKRKVFVDDEVFARGAGYRGADLVSERPIFNFTAICDGHTDSSIYISINKKDRTLSYPIINIGDEWVSTDRTVRVIPYDVKNMELTVLPMDERGRKKISLPLDFLPERPPKTSMLALRIHFIDARNITIELTDLGFGEIYKSSGNKITKEVALWD